MGFASLNNLFSDLEYIRIKNKLKVQNASRVTKFVCEKIAQNVAQPVFVKTFLYNFYNGLLM
jgi:hypothetical protein